MALSEFIKVDLYGQYNNDTTHAYTFPERVKSQFEFTDGTRWVAAIADPRAVFQSVCKSGPCYIVYRHKNGYYYSLVERNLADSRGGLEMITIFVPREKYAAGNSILNALKELRVILIRDRNYDEVLVKQCISRIAMGLPSSVFPMKSSQEATTQPVTAFRTFRSDAELIDLFSFLGQKEYENVDKLLFVGENDVKEGTSIRRVIAEVKKIFGVVKTDNVSADKNEVSVGEPFKITYKKDGFEPLSVNVKLDLIPNNRYYRIDGNKLLLLGTDVLKLRFSKKLVFRIEAVDQSFVETDRAEVLFDGDSAKRLKNGQIYAYVDEDQLTEGRTATLIINCPHFEPYKEIIPLKGLQNNFTHIAKLTPKKKDTPIVFQFDDMGRDVLTLPAINVQMNETDPILRAMQTEFRFYGYPVFASPDGYIVAIPKKRRSQSQQEEKKEGWPHWLKILVITLGSFIIAFLLLVGGYALRSYDVVKIHGLNKPETSGIVTTCPETPVIESKSEVEEAKSAGESSPADTAVVLTSNSFSETQE